MGKTRDLFKKIRDTKGTFHAKMGSIKDRTATAQNRNGWEKERHSIHRNATPDARNYRTEGYNGEVLAHTGLPGDTAINPRSL